MKLEIYGIPNCGTCKKAFQWLANQQIEYDFINTKEQPPSAATIQGWVKDLGSKPLRNTSGQSYRALGADRDHWTEEQWIAAFAQDAMLLKRPLFVRQGQALLAGFRGSDAEIRDRLGL